MLSATRVAAVVAALALGTTFLAVEVSDPPEAAPQRIVSGTDSWAIVTGTQTLVGASPDCEMTARNRNMSDPRFDGDVCIDYESVGDDLATFWSSITVTNADGTWRGHSVGFMGEDEAHHHAGWFEGDGAYQGLALIQQLTEANPKYPSAGVNLDMVGLIYEGKLPPMVAPDWTADTAGDAE